MEIKIDKDIPLPNGKKKKDNKASAFNRAIRQMGLGDSFLFDSKQYHSLIKLTPRVRGKSFTTRKINKNKRRCWRVK